MKGQISRSAWLMISVVLALALLAVLIFGSGILLKAMKNAAGLF